MLKALLESESNEKNTINLLFGLLHLIFELAHPNFIFDVGKPLFPIALSISFPVEMMILLVIKVISKVINIIKLLRK